MRWTQSVVVGSSFPPRACNAAWAEEALPSAADLMLEKSLYKRTCKSCSGLCRCP